MRSNIVRIDPAMSENENMNWIHVSVNDLQPGMIIGVFAGSTRSWVPHSIVIKKCRRVFSSPFIRDLKVFNLVKKKIQDTRLFDNVWVLKA